MWRQNIINEPLRLKPLLKEARVIAIIGLKNDVNGPSYRVASYLQKVGYKIIPVNPKLTEILGEKAYPNLGAIAEPVDIVDIFRTPQKVGVHTDEVLALKPKVVWMQAGIENLKVAKIWAQASIKVVMNRCIMSEHAILFGSKETPNCPICFPKKGK
jgi:predicted CoA-binding protein